jgi:MFS family permease
MLLHALLVNPWFWMLLRVITGVALVGFYTVIESWLNGQAPPERRSQVFAVYMAVNLAALAAAQQLLRLDSPASFTLFAVAAIFVCLSLLPVTATRLKQPELHHTPRLDLRKIWDAAPVAFAGALTSGLAMGRSGARHGGRHRSDRGRRNDGMARRFRAAAALCPRLRLAGWLCTVPVAPRRGRNCRNRRPFHAGAAHLARRAGDDDARRTRAVRRCRGGYRAAGRSGAGH